MTSTLSSTSMKPSMTPSPSFPSQLQISNKPIGMTSSISTAPTTPRNLNNSFLSGLSQMPNTTQKLSMNQMMPPPFLSTQTSQFPNSANSLSTLNPMIPNQSNAAKRNGQESTIALSAQEINDFLS